MSLDTLSHVKTHLEISSDADDTLLSRLMASADAFIADYCQRSFEGGTFIEDQDGGSRTILLRNYPIESVTSIHVDAARVFGNDTLLNASHYYVDEERGRIECLNGPFLNVGTDERGQRILAPGTVRVSYTTPTEEVPESIRRAYAELIGHWYQLAKTAASNGHLNILKVTDGTTITEYPWGQSGGFSLPKGVLQLLKLHRVPSM